MVWHAPLGAISLTPDGHEDLISLDEATQILRCSPAELMDLQGTDLWRGGSLDRHDVMNLGLYAASENSSPRWGMVALGMSIERDRADWAAAAAWQLDIRAVCARSACTDDATWAMPEVESVVETSEHAQEDSTYEHRLCIATVGCRDKFVSSQIERLMIETSAELRFHYRPRDLAGSVAVVERDRVGDCYGLACLLAHRLQEAGFVAEVRSGLLLSMAAAVTHSWVVARDDDGTTKVLDPALYVIARDFFDAPLRERVQAWCIGSTLNRLVAARNEFGFLVTHRCGNDEIRTVPAVRVRRLVRA